MDKNTVHLQQHFKTEQVQKGFNYLKETWKIHLRKQANVYNHETNKNMWKPKNRAEIRARELTRQVIKINIRKVKTNDQKGGREKWNWSYTELHKVRTLRKDNTEHMPWWMCSFYSHCQVYSSPTKSKFAKFAMSVYNFWLHSLLLLVHPFLKLGALFRVNVGNASINTIIIKSHFT